VQATIQRKIAAAIREALTICIKPSGFV